MEAPAPVASQRPESVPEPRGGGLPVPLDSFVGREQALDELVELLPLYRALTLVGPPGMGKTRLAVELVSKVRNRYPGGVWFVDLSSVPGPDMLRQSAAAALGVRERHGRWWPAAWAGAMTGGPVLLLLDNCEHVVDACAQLVVELLGHCAELTVLCTSRELLRVPGELAYAVPGLSCSTAAGDPDSDAVRLFLQRATASRPDLTLTAQERRTLAELCAGLDGCPLAIELAARWVRTLPVADIHARLRDRFDLLVTGSRTATDRQRSLRGALDWSYTTLGADERVVFRRLAVLAGCFDLESATAVCDMGPAEMLHVLAALEAKSLLVPADLGRLRMLESIRLFAREHLESAGELESAQNRLVGRLYGLCTQLTTMSSVTADVRRLLDKEQSRLQHIVEWTISRGDDRQVLLVAALTRSWAYTGHAAESIRLLERVLGNVTAPPADRALALAEMSFLLWCNGEYDRSRELAEQAVTLGRELGDPITLARALQRLALTLRMLVGLEAARKCLEERLALIRPLGPPTQIAMGLNDLAWTAIQQGHPGRARDALVEALSILREHDDPRMLSTVQHTDAVLALLDGDLERAQDTLIECLCPADAARDDVLYAVEGLAIVAARRGQDERALHMIGATAALRIRHDMLPEPWWQRQIDEAEATARRPLIPGDATRALEDGRRMDTDQVRAYALDGLSRDGLGSPASRPLTEREGQVAGLVAEGATNRQISRRLGISERTVESHLKNIRDRLALPSRTAVAVWVTENRRLRHPVPVADP